MKLLLDENLSRKLVVRLAELYPGSAHVANFDLLSRSDRWTHPTRDAELVLRRDAIRLTEFAADPDLGIFVLERG